MKHTEMLRKVPEVTLIFWIIKMLSTGMGEATSDFLVKLIDPVIAVGLGGLGLLIVIVLQFRARKYIPWLYWFAVVMVAIFGTMVADVLHRGLGIPYFISSTFFAVALMIIFFLINAFVRFSRDSEGRLYYSFLLAEIMPYHEEKYFLELVPQSLIRYFVVVYHF